MQFMDLAAFQNFNTFCWCYTSKIILFCPSDCWPSNRHAWCTAPVIIGPHSIRRSWLTTSTPCLKLIVLRALKSIFLWETYAKATERHLPYGILFLLFRCCNRERRKLVALTSGADIVTWYAPLTGRPAVVVVIFVCFGSVQMKWRLTSRNTVRSAAALSWPVLPSPTSPPASWGHPMPAATCTTGSRAYTTVRTRRLSGRSTL